MEGTCCGYCLARDIAMPCLPSSSFRVVAVAEMAAVSSPTLKPRPLTYRGKNQNLLKQFYALCFTTVNTLCIPRNCPSRRRMFKIYS